MYVCTLLRMHSATIVLDHEQDLTVRLFMCLWLCISTQPCLDCKNAAVVCTSVVRLVAKVCVNFA